MTPNTMEGPTGFDPVSIQGLVCKLGGRQVVSELDLVVRRGETVALVGENGCGKTTTMRALTGVLRPSRGTCQLLGEDSKRLSARTFQNVGFVAESQEHYDSLTPNQLFAFLAPFYPGWDRTAERSLVETLDLPLDRPIGKLSRGGKMKAALVASLAYRPDAVLLDEPLAGLDELAKESVLQALRAGRGDSATLLCSHELDDIEDFADRVVLMSEGRVQWSLEKAVLREKVRVVTLSHTGRRGDYAPSWGRINEGNGVVTFVETRFDETETSRAVHAVFSEVSNYVTSPASLKETFRAFAGLRKASRRP